MKVILLKDVKGVGAADTLVNASDGYARNFLFPNKVAVPANDTNVSAMNERIRRKDETKEKEMSALRDIAAKLNGKEISITVDTGESGKLFGSVTSSDIAKKVHEMLGTDIDRKKIVLEEPIKATGRFKVPVKFAHDITADIYINVSASSR